MVSSGLACIVRPARRPKTVLRLRGETVSILGECIFRFFNDLDRWKVPEE